MSWQDIWRLRVQRRAGCLLPVSDLLYRVALKYRNLPFALYLAYPASWLMRLDLALCRLGLVR